MRYITDEGKILISVTELISIARRGISPTRPTEDGEPILSRPAARLCRELTEGREPTALRYDFSLGGYDFVLTGYADRIENGELTLIAGREGRADKPRREEKELMRGAAFLLGYMYTELSGMEDARLNEIFVSDIDGSVVSESETVDRASLKKFFDRCIAAVVKYARPEIERVTVRLPSMARMKFPFAHVRDGQSELVRSAYRALKMGGKLYASAPTGTGKTVSVLYPALRLVGEGVHDKVFYLTPKTTTREVAKSCIELFASEGAVIRAVALSSKERACPNSLVCRKNQSLCPLGFSRVADAALAIYDLALPVVELDVALRVAREYSVCPHELLLTYSELCDVVICDMNYLFDPRAYLRRYFDEGGRYSFLIDEAHNLAERAREMYSANLRPSELSELAENPYLSVYPELCERLTLAADGLYALLYPYVSEDIYTDREGKKHGATHLSTLPSELFGILEGALSDLEAARMSSYKLHDPASDERRLLLTDAYHALRRVIDVAYSFDDEYRMFLFYDDGELRMKLFCVDTSRTLGRILSKGRGAVFFSATLSPLDYYRTVLGGDSSSLMLEASSPFDPESLSVSILDKISTRYSERERTVGALSRAIAAAVAPKRGNYMVFAPSFEYLDSLAEHFQKKHPNVRTLVQKRNMTVAERESFLAEFKSDSEGYLVGFCVMGGVYSEGIDLVGDRLIGAVIVGIGMPSLSYEREAIAEYFEERLEAGKQFAYIYPGMNRVLQAAGRVIRDEGDRGIILLIDDRFDDPIYKKSIPSLWSGMKYVGSAEELNRRVKDFWREQRDKKN